MSVAQRRGPPARWSYSGAQKAWEQPYPGRNKLSIYEKIAAMVSLGQLMRIAEYTTGLRARIGGAFSANKRPCERQNELFLCDVDFPYPTPLPEMIKFEQTLRVLLV